MNRGRSRGRNSVSQGSSDSGGQSRGGRRSGDGRGRAEQQNRPPISCNQSQPPQKSVFGPLRGPQLQSLEIRPYRVWDGSAWGPLASPRRSVRGTDQTRSGRSSGDGRGIIEQQNRPPFSVHLPQPSQLSVFGTLGGPQPQRLEIESDQVCDGSQRSLLDSPGSSGSNQFVSLQPPVLSAPPQLQQIVFGSFHELQVAESTSDPKISCGPPSSDKHEIQLGNIAYKSISLLANLFHVSFNSNQAFINYEVQIKQADATQKGYNLNSDWRMIMDRLFECFPDKFPLMHTVYDGAHNLFSIVELPVGQFDVSYMDYKYKLSIRFVQKLQLSYLKSFLDGEDDVYDDKMILDILTGLDLILKENPFRKRLSLGRFFISPEFRVDKYPCGGVALHRGFLEKLKTTRSGLTLCIDYGSTSLYKPMNVIEFLTEKIEGFKEANDVKKFKREVVNVLINLKVRVHHRDTQQKYTIVGLTDNDAKDVYFKDSRGLSINLVHYFKDRWGAKVQHVNIPCLDFTKYEEKPIYVPMEFCDLVEHQKYDTKRNLKSMLHPKERKRAICEMVVAENGPRGIVAENFGIGLDVNMIRVEGHVIIPPDLMLGKSNVVKVDQQKGSWNVIGKSLADGRPVKWWALVELRENPKDRLDERKFIKSLRQRSKELGMPMEDPIVYHVSTSPMSNLRSNAEIGKLLGIVMDKYNRETTDKLQIMLFVMTRKDASYKFLKYVSETQIGIVTQCCLTYNANNGRDKFFLGLCLKINAKIGGSNFQLSTPLPHFTLDDHVMFIGADVNYVGKKSTCTSAVVGTVNWPAANRYAARICPQRRSERISNFGKMCLELINTYSQINGVKPRKIVTFRDGVSEGQFDMVRKELSDMKNIICGDGYNPTITVVVAQKRHHTRLFLENDGDGDACGNVPPGAVVDAHITSCSKDNFYLCSHYGSIGTSKPVNYYIIYDDNSFTRNRMQDLIHYLCFTSAKCTKSISLVPPVYYADLAAYRGGLYHECCDNSYYKVCCDTDNGMFFI